jgi:hypothetical protein
MKRRMSQRTCETVHASNSDIHRANGSNGARDDEWVKWIGSAAVLVIAQRSLF